MSELEDVFIGPTLIEFGDDWFNPSYIVSISKSKIYRDLRTVYQIEINSPSKVNGSRLRNLIVSYPSENMRDVELENLKEKLIEWGIKFK